jgi:hypothetical protein
MSRNAAVVVAILLVIGISGSPANASSRSVDYGGRGGSGTFRDKHFSGCFRGGTIRYGHGSYDNGAGDLRNRFRSRGVRDVWGHWGAYYGPMI